MDLIKLLNSLARNTIRVKDEVDEESLGFVCVLRGSQRSIIGIAFALDGIAGLKDELSNCGSVPASVDEATVKEAHEMDEVSVISILGVVSSDEAKDGAFNTASWVS